MRKEKIKAASVKVHSRIFIKEPRYEQVKTTKGCGHGINGPVPV
jgi:hypothetical protein